MTETRAQKRDNEDDWTQISNKVMRKRVQNRIAQRNYRKGIKARLNELERLATREASPAITSNTTNQPPSTNSTRDPPLSATDNQIPSRPDIPDMTSAAIHIPGPAFQLDGSAATFMYQNPHSNFPAVSGSLSMASNMPIMREMPFSNTFPVQEWGSDGRLSPASSMMAQQSFVRPQAMAEEAHPMGYQTMPGEMDTLTRNLGQRHPVDCHDMQPYAKLSASPPSAPNQSLRLTESSTEKDRVLSSSSGSAHESDSNVTSLSSRTSPSKHSSSSSCGSVGKERRPDSSGNLSSRIAAAMSNIRELGFSGVEELTAQFYTANLQDRPALADAQRISRRRGLTRMLAKLREHAKDDWTDWESQGYREEIVRAAEDILGEECRRFSEDDDALVSSNGKSTTELKRRFQEELPNLYGLLGVLSLSSSQWAEADHSALIVQAISSLLRGAENGDSGSGTR